jgi:hypothetical protein
MGRSPILLRRAATMVEVARHLSTFFDSQEDQVIAQELIEHITSTTGLETTGEAPLRIANVAGGLLVGGRQWKYTLTGTIVLPSVAGQDWIELPGDFAAFIGHPRVPEAVYHTFTMTTLDAINEKRTYALQEFGHYSGAIVWREKDLTSTPPDRRRVPGLEVYPTPTEDLTEFLRGYYRRRWEDLGSAEDDIPIPRYMEPVLIQYVRAVARGWEEEDEGSMEQRLAQVKAGPIYRAAVVEDVNTQRVYGPVRGGVGDYGGIVHQFGNVGIVGDPS